VAQDVGPEFNSQYQEKKKRVLNHNHRAEYIHTNTSQTDRHRQFWKHPNARCLALSGKSRLCQQRLFLQTWSAEAGGSQRQEACSLLRVQRAISLEALKVTIRFSGELHLFIYICTHLSLHILN
jgi:hypothetical protein